MQAERIKPIEANENASENNSLNLKTSISKPLMVTVLKALELTGIGRTKFYELINQKKIKTITVGKRRLVVYSSLELLAAGETE